MSRCTWFLCLAALTNLAWASTIASAADWPTEGGNNARTFATDDTLQLPLTLRWKYVSAAAPRLAWSSAEGRTIEGIPLAHRIRFDDALRTVVANGRVYFGSTVDHQVVCGELNSGRTLWTFTTGGPVRLSPTVYAGRVYFGSDDGKAYCLHAETGALIWQRRIAPRDEWILARGELISKWPVRTGVLIHNGVAYMGAGIFPHEDVYLVGVDPATGRLVWQENNISAQDAGRNDLSPQGYLLANDNLLFVPSGGSLPGVFDLSAGKLLHKRVHSWRGTAGVVGGTRALLADGQLYTVGEHHVLGMDQKTGDIGFGWFDGRLLAVQGDDAYILTGSRLARLKRLEYAAASRKRRELDVSLSNLGRNLRGKPAAEAEQIRREIQAGQAEQAALEKVGFHWSTPTVDDKALLAAGNVVVAGGAGRVAAYSKADGSEVWAASVNGEVRGLSLADGHLLASTDTGEILCFGTPDIANPPAVVDMRPHTPHPVLSEEIQQTATEILQHTKVSAGYCLIVGNPDGQLAEALARQSELKIYCVDSSPERIQAVQSRLLAVGLYGHRVVAHQADLDDLPYSNYFADLIVSGETPGSGAWPVALHKIERHLRPQGGVLCLGRPSAAGEMAPAVLQSLAATSTIGDQLTPRSAPGWLWLTRGALPGAGNWSHHYGNPGNTAISSDTRIRGDLGVLWYGDPGPGEMVNRHEGAVGPLSVNGKLFVQGETTIMAYDAYNGRHLWTHENPKAVRTGVFQNQNPGNLAASDDSLFHFIGDKCYQVDMATGKQVAAHSLPPGRDDGRYEWGYVATQNGLLFGTATMRQELASAMRRRGRVTDDSTDGLFAIDLATGKHLWKYAGNSISHHTIAIGPDRIFFIDSSITSEQREALLKAENAELAKLPADEQAAMEKRLKSADVRLTVALDLKTGEKLWEQAVDVTDCSDIGIGGGKLTMMYTNNTLVLCGANANGHYWKQFVAGEFKQRRIVSLSAYDGDKLWARDANYKGRPIVIGSKVIAEPWMYDLQTGEQITRKHPITGQDSPWSVMRTGHHCGIFTGCDSGMLLFRSGATGFMDLNADEGIRHFAGHRLGCWINAIAANGLVMIPEASAGCVCQFSIASTIVMEPREIRRPWTIYSAIGAATPVKHLAVNLGAPGDRKDELGTIWFSYPRRDAYQQTALDVRLDLRPQFSTAGGFDNVAEEKIAAAVDTPWVYASWAAGLEQLTLPLLGEGDAPAAYTVRLYFTTPTPESSVCDVSLNGQRVLEGLTLSADQEQQPVEVREFRGISVQRELVIALKALKGTAALCAVEVLREDAAGQ